MSGPERGTEQPPPDPAPAGQYPSGGHQPVGYPSGGYSSTGYPAVGHSGWGANQPASYPAGAYPSEVSPAGAAGAYPSGANPSAGYPSGAYPSAGYPAGAYPSAEQPSRSVSAVPSPPRMSQHGADQYGADQYGADQNSAGWNPVADQRYAPRSGGSFGGAGVDTGARLATPAPVSANLPKLIGFGVAALGLVNFICGFLPEVTSRSSAQSEGSFSVFAIGPAYVPILLLIAGLLAFAALLPGSERSRLAVAAVSVGGAIGAIVSLGTPGVIEQFASPSQVSKGLGAILLVVFGIVQAVVAIVGYVVGGGGGGAGARASARAGGSLSDGHRARDRGNTTGATPGYFESSEQRSDASGAPPPQSGEGYAWQADPRNAQGGWSASASAPPAATPPGSSTSPGSTPTVNVRAYSQTSAAGGPTAGPYGPAEGAYGPGAVGYGPGPGWPQRPQAAQPPFDVQSGHGAGSGWEEPPTGPQRIVQGPSDSQSQHPTDPRGSLADTLLSRSGSSSAEGQKPADVDPGARGRNDPAGVADQPAVGVDAATTAIYARPRNPTTPPQDPPPAEPPSTQS